MSATTGVSTVPTPARVVRTPAAIVRSFMGGVLLSYIQPSCASSRMRLHLEGVSNADCTRGQANTDVSNVRESNQSKTDHVL